MLAAALNVGEGNGVLEARGVDTGLELLGGAGVEDWTGTGVRVEVGVTDIMQVHDMGPPGLTLGIDVAVLIGGSEMGTPTFAHSASTPFRTATEIG